MKVKFITPTDVRSFRKGEATIRFDAKGLVCISGEAIKAIGLEPSEQISIIEDEENEGEFYICRTPPGQDGFTLRSLNGNQHKTQALGFNARGLCRRFIGDSNETHIFKLATTPTLHEKTHYYAILTSARK